MAELSQAELLRKQALAQMAKSGNRVSSDTIKNKIVNFLNDDDQQFVAVESTYAPGKPFAQIVAAFKKQIMDLNLSDLVYPVKDEDHVYLVKLVSDES